MYGKSLSNLCITCVDPSGLIDQRVRTRALNYSSVKNDHFAQRFWMKESLNSFSHEHKELKNDGNIFNAFATNKHERRSVREAPGILVNRDGLWKVYRRFVSLWWKTFIKTWAWYVPGNANGFVACQFQICFGEWIGNLFKLLRALSLFLFLICSHFCEVAFSVKSQQCWCNKEGSKKLKLMFHSAKYSETMFSRVLPGNLRQSPHKLMKFLL